MEEVEQFAPGFATAVRCIYESAWNSVLPKGRNQIKESDFVDAVHASYAPYVDIYRTDSYMAPIVQGEVRRYGTIVCRDLLALPGLIEAKLNS